MLFRSDYVQPNAALASGDLHANSYQHKPYLEQQIKDRGYKLVSVADTVEDKGNTVIDGYKISNYEGKAYGKIGLEKALIHSVNTYFAELGVKLGREKMDDMSKRFLFSKKIPFDIPVTESVSPFIAGQTKTELAAACFGQGKTLVTPLNMALISAH